LAAAGLYGVMAFPSPNERARSAPHGARRAGANIVRLFLRQACDSWRSCGDRAGGSMLALLALTKFWFGFGAVLAESQIREARSTRSPTSR